MEERLQHDPAAQWSRQSHAGGLCRSQCSRHATGRDAALHRGLRAPSRCSTEPNRLKSTKDSTHRWMKEGAQVTSLTDLPLAQGPRVSLFNGVDLNDWDGWLGYADPAETFKKTHSVNPIGAGGVGKDYMVVVVDGEPAIYVNGKTFGSLTHKGDYADYRLSLQFKWGESTYYPKLSDPKDSGLLYHSHGAPGGAFGTWMRSVEFDIVHGRFGSLATVGEGLSSKTTVGRDADLLSPIRRYMVGGREVEIPARVSWFAQ